MTNKVKIMLSSETYVQLYAELAERRMQAFVDADFSKDGDNDVYIEDSNGDIYYSEWAQDEFNWEVGIIESILEAIGEKGMAYERKENDWRNDV